MDRKVDPGVSRLRFQNREMDRKEDLGVNLVRFQNRENRQESGSWSQFPEISKQEVTLYIRPGSTTTRWCEVCVYVCVSADMMGNAMDNIEKLVRQPTGCGEQNMITTVPNIFAMKYLEAIDDVREDFRTKAEGYMKLGRNLDCLGWL